MTKKITTFAKTIFPFFFLSTFLFIQIPPVSAKTLRTADLSPSAAIPNPTPADAGTGTNTDTNTDTNTNTNVNTNTENSTADKKGSKDENSNKNQSDRKTREDSNGTHKKKTAVTPKGKWIIKKQSVIYRVKGKRAKGIQKIKGKYYYFNKHGVQRTGWQKIKDNYYFFRIGNKKKGFMIRSKKVNGITLKKSGQAKLTSKSNAKLNVLLKANKIVEKATKPTMKKTEKREKCFRYALKHFRYSGSPNFSKRKNWELRYALDMFDKGHGNCFAYGAAFAFLANAAGDKSCYAVSSGGHGWSEINGKIYDLSWHLTDRKHNYYGLSYARSGVGGIPNYKAGRSLLKKI